MPAENNNDNMIELIETFGHRSKKQQQKNNNNNNDKDTSSGIFKQNIGPF
jgi:hypothetical protein